MAVEIIVEHKPLKAKIDFGERAAWVAR